MVAPGEIYAHDDYYEDEKTGQLCLKYLLVIAVPAKSDVVYRLLTSQQRARPKFPPCHHGNPVPGYFLGDSLGSPITAPTWLDLRKGDDYDPLEFAAKIKTLAIRLVLTLPTPLLRDIFNCVAAADDTTRGQERCIRDVVATLP
jgi:hypothetical protein